MMSGGLYGYLIHVHGTISAAGQEPPFGAAKSFPASTSDFGPGEDFAEQAGDGHTNRIFM